MLRVTPGLHQAALLFRETRFRKAPPACSSAETLVARLLLGAEEPHAILLAASFRSLPIVAEPTLSQKASRIGSGQVIFAEHSLWFHIRI